MRSAPTVPGSAPNLDPVDVVGLSVLHDVVDPSDVVGPVLHDVVCPVLPDAIPPVRHGDIAPTMLAASSEATAADRHGEPISQALQPISNERQIVLPEQSTGLFLLDSKHHYS